MGRYHDAHRRSIEDPQGFWAEQAKGIDWFRKPGQVLDASNPPFYRWFPDGTLNTCFNALDRHVVDGRAEQAALIYDSPVTGTTRSLHAMPSCWTSSPAFAGVLRDAGRQARGTGW